MCRKGFGRYSSILTRSNFRVGRQVTVLQSLMAYTLCCRQCIFCRSCLRICINVLILIRSYRDSTNLYQSIISNFFKSSIYQHFSYYRQAYNILNTSPVGSNAKFLISTNLLRRMSKYFELTGPQPSSSRPWRLRISHPPFSDRNSLTSDSILLSHISGP